MDQQAQTPEAKPFIDTKLENKVLRSIILCEKDSKVIAEEMSKNLSYLINMGVSKECFSSEFKQWLFQLMVEQ